MGLHFLPQRRHVLDRADRTLQQMWWRYREITESYREEDILDLEMRSGCSLT